jgi:TetR/AcrR family transcriptional regulator of autoinduction and epiphytic fitness
MPKTNSSKRSYNSYRRQESAFQTRQGIARAALQLFTERGYRGASIDAIAEAAAVAPETIYATFGNKRELLHYLLNFSVGGDEAPVHVIDRPDHQATLHETDARRLVAGFSEGIFQIMERAAPVFAILAEAAKTEPELAALLNRLHSERLENISRVAQAIGRLTPLRENESQAADTLWALTSPELFSLMIGARKWTREQYSAWLQDSISRLLLQDEH